MQVATKLNRSHLIHGDVAFLLPCLGRSEIDKQESGTQKVSVEDSTGHMHASIGVVEPAAATLKSEIAIVAGLAKATLPPNDYLKWDEWTGDYALIRDEIARVLPDVFHDFNARFDRAGGFPRPIPARERVWKTDAGKATFIVPRSLIADPDAPDSVDGNDADVLRLMTMRSDDQFNTTIYSLDDRFRRVTGSRAVLLMHPDDIERLGFFEGAVVTATTAVNDGHVRSVRGLTLKGYSIPKGAIGGYFPELNALIPLQHHAKGSMVPAAKSIPVRLSA